MPEVSFTVEELSGVLSLAYMGLTHKYADVSDKKDKTQQENTYLRSLLTIKEYSPDEFQKVLLAVDRMRDVLVANLPEEDEADETEEDADSE